MHEDLIYDFGVNNGLDTEFYLLKGFRVIGIEANPSLYKDLKVKFADYIAKGQLVLLNIGVWSEPLILKFYCNLDNDHFSSFDPNYGCRDNTRFEVVDVQCFSTLELLRRFGLPYYMKIDVEGADKHILADLSLAKALPRYISVEEYGVECVDTLNKLGYNKFKATQQMDKSKLIIPNPPLEGTYVHRYFGGQDSGLFGRELPGEWMDYAEMRPFFIENIRDENMKHVGPMHEWFDVHACLET